MAVHSPQTKLTYDDFVRIPEDHLRHEILDGVHVVSPAPSQEHQLCSSNLHGWLWTYLRSNPIGVLLCAPFDVLLSQHDVVEPDVLFFSKARRHLLTSKHAVGAPDLVAEILSPSTRRRDLGQKRARYELLGVRELWFFDLETESVTVLRRDGATFLPPQTLSAAAEDRLTTDLLPGLQIPLAEIFCPALPDGE